MTTFRRGVLDGSNEVPTSGDNCARRQAWTLSDTGNWTEFQLDANGDGDYSDTGTEEVDQTRTHNDVNEIYNATQEDAITEGANQPQWLAPAYNERGNMTEGPRPGDEATAAKRQFYTYDAWNRLVKVVEDTDGDGNPEAGGDDTVLAEYRYDGLNRRIRKFTDEPESGSDWTVREYYYNAAWQCLEVRKGVESRASGEPAVATAACEQYVWSPRTIDAPVLRDRDTDASTATGDLGKTNSGLDQRLFYITSTARRTGFAAFASQCLPWQANHPDTAD